VSGAAKCIAVIREWRATAGASRAHFGYHPRDRLTRSDPWAQHHRRQAGRPRRPGLRSGTSLCTDTEVITPNGAYPLRRTTWMISNNTATTETLPTWAIVLAILLFFFCLLGLLFLLVKERRTTGYVQVSVQGEGLYYATQVPVTHPAQARTSSSRSTTSAVSSRLSVEPGGGPPRAECRRH